MSPATSKATPRRGAQLLLSYTLPLVLPLPWYMSPRTPTLNVRRLVACQASCAKSDCRRLVARQVVAVAVGVVRRAAVVVEREAVVVAVAVARRAALELGAELELVPAELVGVVGDAAVHLVAGAVRVVEPALRAVRQTGSRRCARTP